ncbi:MAG: cupin domain-containing protein [Nocardioides sp.]
MTLAYVANAADHQQIEWIGGGTVSVLLDTAATAGQLTMVRSRLPKGAAAPVHQHSREDEMFVLLRGSGIFWSGDQRHEVGEGGVVFLPRDVPHAYRMTEDVDMLTLCVPSGMEEFFRGAGHDLATPRPDGWELTHAALAAAAERVGQHLLGPPLDADASMPAAYLQSRVSLPQ